MTKEQLDGLPTNNLIEKRRFQSTEDWSNRNYKFIAKSIKNDMILSNERGKNNCQLTKQVLKVLQKYGIVHRKESHNKE